MVHIEIAWLDAHNQAKLSQLTISSQRALLAVLQEWDASINWPGMFDQKLVWIWDVMAKPDTLCVSGMRVCLLKPLICDVKQARLARVKAKKNIN